MTLRFSTFKIITNSNNMLQVFMIKKKNLTNKI
jgi:hypothetical protein